MGIFNASEFTRKFWEMKNVSDLEMNFLSTSEGKVNKVQY